MKTNKNITLSLSVVGRSKIWGILFLFACLLLASGCGQYDNAFQETEAGASEERLEMKMQLRNGPSSALMDNMSLYVFTPADNFVRKQLNVTKLNNLLTTQMTVGTWNLVLLTCDTDLTGLVSLPPYDGLAAASPMWTTRLIAPANEFLSQASEELCYASMSGVNVLSDQTTTKDAKLQRNVAKIQVILKDYTGFDPISTTTLSSEYAFIDLLDVPTTLNWKGEYLPSKTNPAHSGEIPLREYLKFKEQAPGEKLKADTLNFIIPAHRGSDAFEVQHNDTTTHKLRFRASMPLKGNSFFGKSKTPIEISFVPKINRIVQLELIFRGEPDAELDVKVRVKDWGTTPDQVVEFD